MDVSFSSYDGRHRKRWLPKVARAACGQIAPLFEDTSGEFAELLCAEFDTESDTPVMVTHMVDPHTPHWVVSFAARSWDTLQESIPSAVHQYSSVLPLIVQPDLRAPVRDILANAGLATDFPVTTRVTRMPVDSRGLYVLYFPADSFSLDQFFEAYDELDSALQETSAGEVDGSSVGRDFTLDVATSDLASALAVIRSFLDFHGLSGLCRFVDCRTGEEVPIDA